HFHFVSPGLLPGREGSGGRGAFGTALQNTRVRFLGVLLDPMRDNDLRAAHPGRDLGLMVRTERPVVVDGQARPASRLPAQPAPPECPRSRASSLEPSAADGALGLALTFHDAHLPKIRGYLPRSTGPPVTGDRRQVSLLNRTPGYLRILT